LAQKLIARKCKQKVFNFGKIYTPRFLGCYTGRPSFQTENLECPEQAGRATRAHRPRKVTHPGRQLCWQGREHTKVLEDLSIKARRPQGGRFGVQMTNIAAGHLAEP
jgi:hypothetical protein